MFLVATGTAANALGDRRLCAAGRRRLLPPPRAYQGRRGRRLGVLRRRHEAGRARRPRRQVHAGGAGGGARALSRRPCPLRAAGGRGACPSSPNSARLPAPRGARRLPTSPRRRGWPSTWTGRALPMPWRRSAVAGRHHLAGGRRRALLRRHQERLHRGRGGGLLRPGAGARFRLRPAAGRATASRRPGSSPRSSTPISTDGHWLDLAATPTRWRRGSRRRSAPGHGAAGGRARRQRGLRDPAEGARRAAEGGRRDLPSVVGRDAAAEERPGPDEVSRPADHVVPDAGAEDVDRFAALLAREAEAEKKKGAPEGALVRVRTRSSAVTRRPWPRPASRLSAPCCR